MTNTPDNITELKPNEVFVFGSNRLGAHRGGAARYAYDHFGAELSNSEGIQGQSYALPTMDKDMKPYSSYNLKKVVNSFVYYARQHPEKTFLLTKVGCGIAGFTEAQIAPLFRHTPGNVVKPKGW